MRRLDARTSILIHEGLALMALLAWPVAPARADGPTITLPSSYTQSCQSGPPSHCYYSASPATQVPMSGSGFSSSDTSVAISGLPSATDSSATCNASNGSFSCTYVIPDVPTESINGWPLTMTITGSPSGDSATIYWRRWVFT